MEKLRIQSIKDIPTHKSMLSKIKVWVCSCASGKSYLCSIDDRFFDLDEYQGSLSVQDEAGLEQKVISKMNEKLDEGKIVLQASHKYFLQYLDENNIPFVFMYGKPEVQEEYCERMLRRGSGEEFVEKFGTGIGERYYKKVMDERPTVKIELSKHEYASDYLWKVFGRPSKYINFNNFDKDKYKIIFIDLDGTLLNREHQLTEFTRKTIQKLKDRISIVFVSGRSAESVLPIMKECGLTRECDFAICAFGALVINGKGEMVSGSFLSERELELFTNKVDGSVLDKCYFNVLYGRVSRRDIKDLKQFYKNNKIYKIVYEFGQKLNYVFPVDIMTGFYVYKGQQIVEFVNRNCGKFSALHAFAGGKNIKLEDVLAFGNEITDMEMLRNVGCGIAVCNAPKYVKDNVKYIADSYNDDGVAKALLKILDIK